MNIPVDDIKFGDPDALHELMQQDRDGSNVLMNSFVAPPRANLKQLETGSKFFIVGPKGSGKTTILLHLRRQQKNMTSSLVLFKSKIRKEDRAKLDRMTQTVVVGDQGAFQVDTDYKTVWEWYLLKNFFRLLDLDDVVVGKQYFHDISLLLEADKKKFNTLFDSMKVDGVKGRIKISVNAGVLQSEIGAEIEARRKNDNEIDLLDLVRLAQEGIKQIKLKPDAGCRLYLDELEFFLEEYGDGERDRRLVRDLIYTVYNLNFLFHEAGWDARVYACVRSEVIHSFPGSSSELNKLIRSFSISLNWEPLRHGDSAIIEIFERKIQNSEIECAGRYSNDVWSRYFPEKVFDKETKRFLLDMGSHRPRGVLLCLLAASERAWGRDHFVESDFDDGDNTFAQSMLDEFKDELAANLFDFEIEAVFAILRGKHFSFNFQDFKKRCYELEGQMESVKKLKARRKMEWVVETMYRCGVIGNYFKSESAGLPRQTWAARGYPDPIMDKPFIVHQSVQRLLDTV